MSSWICTLSLMTTSVVAAILSAASLAQEVGFGRFPGQPSLGSALPTFCERNGIKSDLVGVAWDNRRSILFTTSFESECESIRRQMSENSGCFCGEPSGSIDDQLVCVDRNAYPQVLGSFSFKSDCEQALKNISQKKPPAPPDGRRAGIRTFCRPARSNYEVVGLAWNNRPSVIFTTTFEFECESVRKQMVEKSDCFCGEPAVGTSENLVCVDRYAEPSVLGSFDFKFQCEKALDQLNQGRVIRPM